MNIDYTPEELAFQKKIRKWFKENLPDDLKRKNLNGVTLTKEEIVAWQKTLSEAGYLVVGWPQEWGGPGWTATQRYIFDAERATAGAPVGISMGIIMLGPVLMAFGTQEQKEKYLPKIRNCEDWWCQGYSEPGSGSDLASLKCQAVLDGDDYVINGTKIWTTYAHFANRCFCLVRTNNDCKPQAGISFILIDDMSAPGIEIQPITSIDGEHHLNQVFFDNVRVPKKNLVGAEGQGWTVAKYLLTHERTTIAGVADSKLNLTNLKEIARKKQMNGKPLNEDPSIRRRLAEEEIKLIALEYTNFRTLADTAAGRAPGPESSLLKIKGTETQQSLSELAVEMAGYFAFPWKTGAPEGPEEFQHATERYNFLRACTIYGGSTEVQKNVVAKMLLGLG